MKLSDKRTILSGGFALILIALFILYKRYYFALDKAWTINVQGNKNINDSEITELVSFFFKANDHSVTSVDLKNYLELHPRIKECKIALNDHEINIVINEHESSYLEHRGNYFSEYSPTGEILIEKIQQIRHLNPDQPIFYLTAPNENETLLIKRDIIQIWNKTKYSYHFLWSRISEIEIAKDNLGHPEVFVYTTGHQAKLQIGKKFDQESFRRIWAIIYYLDDQKINKPLDIQIFKDHAIIL